MENIIFYSFLYIYIYIYRRFSQYASSATQDKDFFQHNAKSNKIKLREQFFFPDQDFIRYSCFHVVANLILNTVRVKWVLLQSIYEIDETLDGVNDFMFFAIFAISLQYFHSSQFCVSRDPCFEYVVHNLTSWTCQRSVQYAVTCTAL